jgi:predicted nucleic acid-binding protein
MGNSSVFSIALPDSSAWIEHFHGNTAYDFIDDLIADDHIYTNDVVLTELLPSMRQMNEKKFINALLKLPTLPLAIDWEEIQRYQLQNLRHGNNHVPISDMLIAQNALQHNASLIANDKHFDLMAVYLPLAVLTGRQQT